MLRECTNWTVFSGRHRESCGSASQTFVVAAMVSPVSASGPISYALLALYIFCGHSNFGIEPKIVVRGLKPWFIVAFTAILNLFYTPKCVKLTLKLTDAR